MNPFQLEAFLPYRINRLAERMSDSLSRVYRERFAISVAQWRILATLHDAPGLAAKEVARATNLDKVRVSRALAELKERGLVLRRLSRADGRSNELRLSAPGLRLFRQIAPLALNWERDYLHGLSDAQRRRLFHLLDKLDPNPPIPAQAPRRPRAGAPSP